MGLNLRNISPNWISISKIVFSAYGMKLYYNGDVLMQAYMDILNRNTANRSLAGAYQWGAKKQSS